MRAPLPRLLTLGAVSLVASVTLRWDAPPLLAHNHDVIINEAMAGANGNSQIQFVELTMFGAGENCWGPQVSVSTTGADANDGDCGSNETRSRTVLFFYDAVGREVGRYKFPENPPSGANVTVLVATQAFANLTGAPVPDFIMPPLMNPIDGKVCFVNNTENLSSDAVTACLSYGAFTGTSSGEGTPAPALSTIDTVSLARISGTANTNNSFATTSTPTPTNSAGQTFTITVASQTAQGDILFNQETFGGNGRTCGQCHVISLDGRLTPANVQSRFSTLSTTFDPLFIAESTMNLNTLAITARPTPASGTDFLNTSGGDLQGTFSQSGVVKGKVLARVSATSYLVFGGVGMTGTFTDASGNQATVASVTAGGLNAIEEPSRMRTSLSEDFPDGRALILENVDGFAFAPVFRKSPHLVNLRLTAPYGFSGLKADLLTFATDAVTQHATRTLARVSTGSSPDFRLPTAGELAAIEAFQLGIEFPAGSDPDKFNLTRFVTTAEQQRGMDAFFGGEAKCSLCHGGSVLSTTTVSLLNKGIGVNASFNTGVVRQPINLTAVDNLPCEPDPAVGQCFSREFSVPQLFNIGSLGPYFHDSSMATLQEAVNFYDSIVFRNSPAGQALIATQPIGQINMGPGMVRDITAFLLALDASPKVGDIAAQTVNEDTAAGPVGFILKDVDTSTSSLTLSAVSTNTTLLPAANITFGGSEGNRTVTATPAANRFGTTNVTVTVSDGALMSTSTFALTVNSVNDAPTISSVAAQAIAKGSSTSALAVTVGDVETAAAALTLSATSSNLTLVPASGVVLGGLGASRTVTVTPVSTQSGSATMTLTVSDGTTSTSTSFQLVVNSTADPQMALDLPATNSSSTQPVTVAGWAIDAGAGSGTGIDHVHVYAFPVSGGAPTFLGVASYGTSRSDVGAVFGTPFVSSGFSLTAGGLTNGATYDIGAYPHSTVSNSFSQVRFARVTIVAPTSIPAMNVDQPTTAATVNPTFTVSGWAVDRGSATGTGVDAIHMWAFPTAGGAPTFAGEATYGASRADVGAVFGGSFTNSGFSFSATLTSGTYTLAVYARSTVTGTFNQQQNVTISVQPPASNPAMALDAPVTNSSLSLPFVLAGWAVDRGASAGTGVDAIHVYAFPVTGGAPTFVGVASYGSARADVGAVFGANFTNSGFTLSVSALAPGTYDLGVYARSTVSSSFNQQRVARVTIPSGSDQGQTGVRLGSDQGQTPVPVVEPDTTDGLRMSVDAPADATEIGGAFSVAGWAVDRGSQAGTGIGGVHVWANGSYLGMARTGEARPDVAAILGPQFQDSGWRLEVSGLSPGSYEIAVYAWSDRTGRFEVAQSVRVVVR